MTHRTAVAEPGGAKGGLCCTHCADSAKPTHDLCAVATPAAPDAELVAEIHRRNAGSRKPHRFHVIGLARGLWPKDHGPATTIHCFPAGYLLNHCRRIDHRSLPLVSFGASPRLFHSRPTLQPSPRRPTPSARTAVDFRVPRSPLLSFRCAIASVMGQ